MKGSRYFFETIQIVLKENMDAKHILLVEANPDDELLTIRALKKNNIINKVVTARDGTEALDYLFGTGTYADRDTRVMPQVVMLDLKLPKIDGIEVLKRLRGDERTKELPVIIFTSSKEEFDLIKNFELGNNIYIQKPVGYTQFTEAIRQLGLCLLVLDKSHVSDKDQAKTEKTVDTTSDDKLFSAETPTIADRNTMLDKSAVNAHLLELISNMSQDETQELIGELEKKQKTKASEKRKHPRKQAFIIADCSAPNCSFSDFIQNISAGGLFIETSIPVFMNQELTVTFTLPKTQDPIKMTGKVVRSDQKGVAVAFNEILSNL